MKLIKLTTKYLGVKADLYLNPSHIGHIYDVPEKMEYNVLKERHTRIGCLTHNNGGFSVMETVEEVVNMIQNI